MKGKDLDQYMINIHKDFSIYLKSHDEWLGTFRSVVEKIEKKIKDDF